MGAQDLRNLPQVRWSDLVLPRHAFVGEMKGNGQAGPTLAGFRSALEHERSGKELESLPATKVIIMSSHNARAPPGPARRTLAQRNTQDSARRTLGCKIYENLWLDSGRGSEYIAPCGTA